MSPDAKMTRDRITMTLCVTVMLLVLAGLLAVSYVDVRSLYALSRVF